MCLTVCLYFVPIDIHQLLCQGAWLKSLHSVLPSAFQHVGAQLFVLNNLSQCFRNCVHAVRVNLQRVRASSFRERRHIACYDRASVEKRLYYRQSETFVESRIDKNLSSSIQSLQLMVVTDVWRPDKHLFNSLRGDVSQHLGLVFPSIAYDY